jgi:uncharacterized iron-regulated membrane protein
MNAIQAASCRRLLWRLHFWAGLLGAPIVLFAAVTGLIYLVNPQIEALRYAELDHVTAAPSRLALDAQVAAAQHAAPDSTVRFAVPGHAATDSTRVYMQLHHGARPTAEHDHGLLTGSIVYVNPYTAQVLGQTPELKRFKTWAQKLHSSALLGNAWRWVMELGASWMLVLMASGVVLWWPQLQAAGWRVMQPSLRGGRRTWRDLHALVALSMGLVLVIILVTGLTWAEHSGDKFRTLQANLRQNAPKVPNTLQSTPNSRPPLTWQTVLQHAQATSPQIALQITPPVGAQGVWRLENFDRSQPEKRFTQALDAYSGQVLFSSGWAQMPPLAQATAVGIPFHRGELGLWNQVLLVLAALSAIFSTLSGLAMWWLRRPRGQVAAPKFTRADLRHQPTALWLTAATLAWLLPVWGVSLGILVVVEGVRLWCKPVGRLAKSGGTQPSRL